MIFNLFWEIDKSKKPKEIRLWLCKPNMQTIARLKDVVVRKMNIRLGQIDELEFVVPYFIERDNEIIRNHYIDLIRERYLIKMKYGDVTEYFIVQKSKKIENEDENVLEVICYSRAYEISYKRIRGYNKSSLNCRQALTDCLEGTNWTIGHIDAELDLMFRGFDVSSKTKLEFLFEICEVFENSIPIFDTVNRTVSIYKQENVGQFRGLKVRYGQLLQNIEYETDLDQVCTRLHCYGQNRNSIHRTNLLGTTYIDDFSYYLYPFERDKNKNVIKSSYYMSDSLCQAILDHQELLQSRQGEFSNYLLQIDNLRTQLNARQIELINLQMELKIILDEIAIKTETGEDTKQLITNRDNKEKQIDQKQSEIDNLNNQIQNIENKIQQLKDLVSYHNNFTPEQLIELNDYVFEKEFINDSIVNDIDLINEGRKYLDEINTPPINVRVDIVNFLNVVEEQRKWDLLKLGDFIDIKHDQLNIDIKSRIVGIEFNFEDEDIVLEISNGKDVLSDEEQFIKDLYKALFSTGDWQNNKHNLQSITMNFNRRNDRNSTKPANPTVKNDGTAVQHTKNKDGSVNISFSWDYMGAGDAYNIDGFNIYLYASDVSDSYVFGSTIAKEQVFVVTPEKRGFIVYGVPANKYYTWGVQAYRRVDSDINSDGILLSDIVKSHHPTENPYLPSANVEFEGDISGTIGGIPLDEISKVLTGVYTGNGSGSSRAINVPFSPKQVTIFGGYERDGVNYNARFELSSSKAFIINTNNQSSESTDLKCTASGFTVGNSNNLANVDGQLYEWVAYG